MAPRLNLLSRPALLALLHRALANGSDGGNALTGLRRIELTQEEQTESLKLVSEFGSTAEILREKVRETKRRAQQAGIDVRLHSETKPPEGKRGLFGPRLTPEQRQHAASSKQVEFFAKELGADAEAAAAALANCEGQLEASRKRLEAAKSQQANLVATLHSELAACVLDSLMSDASGTKAADAFETLGEARQVARGDLMVGSLFVLSAQFGQPRLEDGLTPAREMLREMHLLFSQHNDPAQRVLSAMLQLVESGLRENSSPPSLTALGILAPGTFGVALHYRLYLLLLVLCGQDSGAAAAAMDTGFAALLAAVSAVARNAPPGTVAGPGSGILLLERVLTGSLLLDEGARHLIPGAVGVDLDRLEQSRGKNPRWPLLWDIVSALPADPWPAAALSEWRAALACLLLLGARAHPVSTMYVQWLEESYGWPKSDFYWWTLSTLKDDPALLRNLVGGSVQLFSAATASGSVGG